MQHGYENDAAAYLEIVTKGDQKSMSDYDKGRLCYYHGEYTQACNYLERARNAAPSAELISLLGECYKKLGQ